MTGPVIFLVKYGKEMPVACSDAIFLKCGTGIGAGIMINNQVLRGANDIGGAIGWMGLDKPFEKKFIPCGCFEYNASGEGIVKVAKELIAEKKFTESILNNKDLNQLSAKDIFDAYDEMINWRSW